MSVLEPGRARWVADAIGVGDLVHVEARVEEASYGEEDTKTYVVNVVAEEFNLLRRKGQETDRKRAA